MLKGSRASAQKGTKSCKTQGKSAHPSIRLSIRSAKKPKNGLNPSIMAQIQAKSGQNLDIGGHNIDLRGQYDGPSIGVFWLDLGPFVEFGQLCLDLGHFA